MMMAPKGVLLNIEQQKSMAPSEVTTTTNNTATTETSYNSICNNNNIGGKRLPTPLNDDDLKSKSDDSDMKLMYYNQEKMSETSTNVQVKNTDMKLNGSNVSGDDSKTSKLSNTTILPSRNIAENSNTANSNNNSNHNASTTSASSVMPNVPSTSSISSNRPSIIPALSIVAEIQQQFSTEAITNSTAKPVNNNGKPLNGLINMSCPSGVDISTTPVPTQQAQKRPMNAFLIFCKRHRSVVRQTYPRLENRSITKILGEWWAALDADEKHHYTDLARQYKEAFMKANPNFKWYKTADLKPPPPPIIASSQANPILTHSQTNSLQQPSTTSLSSTSANKITVAYSNSSNVIVSSIETTATATSHSTNASTASNSGVINLNVSVISTDSTNKSQAMLSNGSPSLSPTTTSGSTRNSSSSTPKPPKKRYLESLESGIEYSKNTSCGSPSGNNVISTGNSAITNTKTNVTNTASFASSTGAGLYKMGPLLFLDDTASMIIEKQLGENDSWSKPSSSELNQSKFDMPISNNSLTVKSSTQSLSSTGNSFHYNNDGNSGSETASDDDSNQMYIDEQSSPSSATKTVNSGLTTLNQPQDDDVPLNLSATTNIEKTHSSRTLSNQQIIDRYIDKLLSNECLDPNTNDNETSIKSSAGSINFNTNNVSTTNNLSSTSKLVLEPKDFSLRSSTTSANSPQASTINNSLKRPIDSLVDSSSKIGPVAGSSPSNKQDIGGTPSKRNRINGTVIGVSDMIAASNNSNNNSISGAFAGNSGVGSGTAVTSGSLSVDNNTLSKYVTGSFDLEEHIRALPQLAETHLVNALHLRNQEFKSSTALTTITTTQITSPTKTVSGTPVMLMSAAATTVNSLTTSNQFKQNVGNSGLLMKTVQLNPHSTLMSTSSIPHSMQQPENLSSQTKISTAVTSAINMLPASAFKSSGLNLSMVSTTNATGINNHASMEALPLRLAAAVNNPGSRMQLSSSVLIKLGSGQTIAVPAAGPGQVATVQTFDGNLVQLASPLIIRAPPTAGSPAMITGPMGANSSATTNNKPVDLSMALHQSNQSDPTSVTMAGLQHLSVRTNPASTAQQAYLSPIAVQPITVSTTGVGQRTTISDPSIATSVSSSLTSPLLLSISSAPSISLASSTNAAITTTPTTVNGNATNISNGGVEKLQQPAPPSPSSSSSSSSTTSSMFSTVISSHGSINQCDGLAALAEIALQQARNSIT